MEWSARQEALQPMILQAFRTERRNAEMDAFLAKLITKLREEGILALVVKGQAVGHLYANPSVRQAGDIDLFLDRPNYQKAKAFLSEKATQVAEFYDHNGFSCTAEYPDGKKTYVLDLRDADLHIAEYYDIKITRYGR